MEPDTLIIGGSAAGLATAATLRRRGVDATILEASDAVGHAWRHHYDRLHLHTPKSSSALPGLPMPAGYPRYPSRDQVVAYLEQYAAHHGLQPRFGERVSAIAQDGDGWRVTSTTREWTPRRVVIATGYTRVPHRPTWPGLDTFGGEVMHSSEFRNGAAFAGRPVVVVGFGNSACEQALDLVEHGAEVHLAVRSAVNVVPRDIFGLVPVLQVGIVTRHLPPALADALSAPLVALTVGDIRRHGLRKLPYGPAVQIARDRRIPLLDIGTMDAIRRGAIVVHPNVAEVDATHVTFEDGVRVPADAMVLATGYRPALREILEDADDVIADGIPSGQPTSRPGLYFCGFFVSPAGMLREIGIEAERIARHVAGA